MITADGSRVAYRATEDNWTIYAVPSSGGEPQALCKNCGNAYPLDWSKDKTRLLYLAGNPSEVFILDIRSAQRLEPLTKRPAGPPFAVQHFHAARLSMMNTGFSRLETAVTNDRIFINIGEFSGNLWTMRLP